MSVLLSRFRNTCGFLMVLLMVLFGATAVAQQPTSTSLEITAAGSTVTSVASGAPLTLTATVNGTTSGTVTVVDSVLAHLRTGDSYVNVHTAARPSGEIRGQLVRTQ